MFGSMRRNDSGSALPNDDLQAQSSSITNPLPAQTTSLSWETRIQWFVSFMSLSIISSFCASYLLVLTKVTGFCIMTSISAVLSLASTLFLMGPVEQVKKMFHKTRWLASTAYLVCIVMAIISGLVLKNTALAIIFTVGQYAAMLYYSLSYIPYAREMLNKLLCCW